MGEKMFWVPESILKNLVQPVTEEVRLSAMHEVCDILEGKVERRPSLTPTAEEYTRYFNHHVTDEGLAQMAGDRGYSLVKRVEVRSDDTQAHVDAMAKNLADWGQAQATRETNVAARINGAEKVESTLDDRGVLNQTDGTPRLCLGVNNDLGVKGDTQTVELELGTFNTDKISTPHRLYRISRERLTAEMEKLVGKPIGEIGQSQFYVGDDPTAAFERLLTTAPVDAWGFLESYRIEELEDGSLRVRGTVQLTNRGRVMLADTGRALCSIRSHALISSLGPFPGVSLVNINAIGGFDLVAE